MYIKYVAIIAYFFTCEYDLLNMTSFRTVSNLLEKTITRLETKKPDGRDGILSTESYPPHVCACPNPGPIFLCSMS